MFVRDTLERVGQSSAVFLREINDQPADVGKTPLSQATCGSLPYSYLPTGSRQAWEQATHRWVYPFESDYLRWSRFVRLARMVAEKHLTPAMLKMLQTCADPGGIDGFVLDNLPNGYPGPAPTDGRRPRGKSGESEAVLLGIIYAALCFVLGYHQEKRGDLVHQVAPIQGEEALQSNGGRTKFGWHIDNAFLPLFFQPQYLALFGLVNERDVPTLLLSLSKDILPALPSELLRRMETSMFLLPAPHSFDFGGRQVVTQPRPVIYRDEHGIDRIALPRSDYIQPDPVAARAILEFRELLDSLTPRTVVIQPGRMLVFSNSRYIHARSAFSGERWLQRAYFTSSLDAHRAAAGADSTQHVFDAGCFLA